MSLRGKWRDQVEKTLQQDYPEILLQSQKVRKDLLRMAQNLKAWRKWEKAGKTYWRKAEKI